MAHPSTYLVLKLVVLGGKSVDFCLDLLELLLFLYAALLGRLSVLHKSVK